MYKNLKTFIKRHKIEVREFSDGSKWLVMYKAVTKAGNGWARCWRVNKREKPYVPGNYVVANGLDLYPSTLCGRGLHVTTLRLAKLVWCKAWGIGSASKIVEVLVPLKDRCGMDNIIVPMQAIEYPKEGKKQKIRCRELYVNRVVPESEWPGT